MGDVDFWLMNTEAGDVVGNKEGFNGVNCAAKGRENGRD